MIRPTPGWFGIHKPTLPRNQARARVAIADAGLPKNPHSTPLPSDGRGGIAHLFRTGQLAVAHQVGHARMAESHSTKVNGHSKLEH